ncbi:MAG: T9SS type A sorting domain-containing protein [bacterium]|nr:MAG: T9SS type A sorting domain-containing protein [bacterium]
MMKLSVVLFLSLFILSYSNAQNSWHSQNSGTNKFLTGVFFLDDNLGWAAGWTGTILHTTDGGQIWVDQNAPPTNAYSSIQFADNQTGWAVGFAGRIVRTTDGGSTWNIQSSGTQYSINDLHFVNSDKGWTVGGKARDFTDPIREILNTNNGGLTWSRQMFDSGKEPLSSIFFLDENIGFAVGSFSTILRTDDGGNNWVEQMYGTDYQFRDVFFVNSDTGWVVGQDNSLQHYAVIFNTTDGGTSWNSQNLGNDESLSSIYFVDDSTGWAVGGTSTTSLILHTSDGGMNWTPQASGTSNFLTSIHFVNENNGWAVGYDGTIIRYGAVITTVENIGRDNLLPQTVQLENNYPNPFNPITQIAFSLPQNSTVSLKIFSVTGQLVNTLISSSLSAGQYTVTWDGTNPYGQAVSSGVYIYQLKAGNEIRTKRMHLLK